MSILRGLRDQPRGLEVVYRFADRLLERLQPLIRRLGYARVDRWLRVPERLGKQAVFNCQMCGQCTLHATGMTCPMGCPKNLRNGPCGGVRADKSCEVDPGMPCVWVEAYERSSRMRVYGDDLFKLQPPLNHRLAGSSAFINILSEQGAGMPPVWQTDTGLSHDCS